MRRTISHVVKFRGVGLHSGEPAVLTVAPAAPHSGILFQRIGKGGGTRPIPARYDFVCDTYLSTSLGDGDGICIGTVEHLMAALSGCGITDALVCLDGPEVPVLDGSAIEFVRAFVRAGIRDLGLPCRAIRILEPVAVRIGDRMAELAPAPRFEMAFRIRFEDRAIGAQSKFLVLTGSTLVAELSDSRTFGRLADVEMLRRKGLGRGGSLENVVVVDNDRVLNPEGLRHPDEFVRHKMLDAAGDLALAGAPIIGRYTGIKAGHRLSNLLLRALFSCPERWTWCDLEPGQAPGGPLPLPAGDVTAARIAV